MRTSWRAETAPLKTSDTPGLRLLLPAVAGVGATWVLWRLTTSATAVPPRLVLAAIPIYLALWLATVLLHAIRWRMILRRLGTDLPLGRLVRLWLAARAVGSLVPSGTLAGEPVRAQLLVANGMPSAPAAGAVALDRALELAGNTIGAPACVAAALTLGAGSAAGMGTAAGVALLGLGMLAGIYLRARGGRPALVPLARPFTFLPRRWRERLRHEAARADTALQTVLAEHPRLVPAGLAVSLVIEALHILEMLALFAVFAIDLPLPLVLLSSLGIGVAHAVPVTAALGALEATQVGLVTVSGQPLATGLAVAMATRSAETTAILVGLVCLATAPSSAARRANRC